MKSIANGGKYIEEDMKERSGCGQDLLSIKSEVIVSNIEHHQF